MSSNINISVQETLDTVSIEVSDSDLEVNILVEENTEQEVNISIQDGRDGRDGSNGRDGTNGRDGSDYGTTLFSISVLFESVSTFRYVAAESFKVNQINNPDGLTITLEVNAAPYTLGDTIEQYDELTIDVNLVGFVNLRCEEV